MTIRPELRYLTLILTTRCNLSCAYCYQRSAAPADLPEAVAETALHWAADCARAGGGRVEIGLSGGEPLLCATLVRRLLESGREEGLLRFRLLTNGLLLTPELTAMLVEHDVALQLSLDGVAAAQDLRGAGTSPVLDRLLRRLRHDHADWFARRVRVAATVVPAAIPQLGESVEYLLARGVRDLTLAPSIAPADDWSDELLAPLDEAFVRIERACRARAVPGQPAPVALYRGRPRPPFDPGFDELPRDLPLCGQARTDAVAVGADGGVHPCSTLATCGYGSQRPELRGLLERMRIGRFDENGFHPEPVGGPDAGIEPWFTGKERKRSRYSACAECEFLKQCSLCPMSLLLRGEGGDPDRIPAFPCAFTRAALGSRRRFGAGR